MSRTILRQSASSPKSPGGSRGEKLSKNFIALEYFGVKFEVCGGESLSLKDEGVRNAESFCVPTNSFLACAYKAGKKFLLEGWQDSYLGGRWGANHGEGSKVRALSWGSISHDSQEPGYFDRGGKKCRERSL